MSRYFIGHAIPSTPAGSTLGFGIRRVRGGGGGAVAAEYPAPDSGTVHTITPADFRLGDHGLTHSCPAVICPGYERENTSDRQFAKYEISTKNVADGDTVIFTDGTYDIDGPIVIRHTDLTISSDDGDGVLIRSTDNKGLVFRNHGDVSGLEIRGFSMASADTTRLAPARNFAMVFIEDTAGLDDIKILDNTFRGDKQNGVRIGSSDQSSLFTNVEIRDNMFETIPDDRYPVHTSNTEVTLFANSFERSNYVHRDGDGSLIDLYNIYPGKPDRAPVVTPPPAVELEATGPLTVVTPEQLGTATARDDRDQSPVISNDSPGSFAVGNHTVTWTATDSTGNSGTATQTVTIRDTTPPAVTLIGDSSVTVEQDGTYEEMYATCTDLVDGDLPMTMNDVLDISTPGEYTLKYSCTDAAGNPASVTRTVTVVAPVSTQPTDLKIDAWHLAHPGFIEKNWILVSVNWTEPDQPTAAGYNVTVSRPDGTLRPLSTFGLLLPAENSREVYSYNMDGSRDPEGDFARKLAPFSQGIDIQDSTIYMAAIDGRVHSYHLNGTHIPGLTHWLPDAERPTGIVAHDGKVWVAMRNVSSADSRVFSYDPATGTRAGGFFTHANNTAPTGITELGGLLYVLDGTANSVFAYRTDGTYVPDMSFGLDPATIWAKGISAHPETNTMWVLDNEGDRVYAYSAPADNGTRLATFAFDLEPGTYGGIALTPAVTSDTITVPSGTNGTAYYYSSYTQYFAHTVQSATPRADPPATVKTRNFGVASLAMPTDFAIVSHDHDSVSISWTPPSDDSGILNYQLFADRGTKFPPHYSDRDARAYVDPSVTSHTLTGLQPDTEYIVTIRSYNTYDVKQRIWDDDTHRESIPVSLVFTTDPPSPAVFHDTFDADLGQWTYQERPYGSLNAMFCGADDITAAYSLTLSNDDGGSAHVMNGNMCWFGLAGASRTFDVPAGYGGGDLIVSLDYRTQADFGSQTLGGRANNLFYAVTDSAGDDLDNGTLFLGKRNTTEDDSDWTTATITVQGLAASSCPCEIIVYTADMGWDAYNKRFSIDNVNATMTSP